MSVKFWIWRKTIFPLIISLIKVSTIEAKQEKIEQTFFQTLIAVYSIQIFYNMQRNFHPDCGLFSYFDSFHDNWNLETFRKIQETRKRIVLVSLCWLESFSVDVTSSETLEIVYSLHTNWFGLSFISFCLSEYYC